MTLSRWRRVVTGVAAGVIVLVAALIGASFRDDNGGVSVASDTRPENVIPIELDPSDDADDDSATATASPGAVDEATDAAPETADTAVDESDPGDALDDENVEVPDADVPDAVTPDNADTPDGTGTPDDTDSDDALTDPVQVIEDDDAVASGDTTDDAVESQADDSTSEPEASEPASGDATETPADAPPAESPVAPLTAADSSLGTGGGVDDAECALDRLVIYAGARRGGVAGSIRAALTQAGFGAGCPTPVTVLASNCPLQFSGVLGTESGYDPYTSFVAANANVDRATMTAVMSAVGYTGTQIDILDFGFVNADRPGEQWMAIFIPPSFDGWQDLAARAGLTPTTSSLCSPSGQLAG